LASTPGPKFDSIATRFSIDLPAFSTLDRLVNRLRTGGLSNAGSAMTQGSKAAPVVTDEHCSVPSRQHFSKPPRKLFPVQGYPSCDSNSREDGISSAAID
jgi:hypothetical protein